ncbi:uncharacterized protein MEPE_00289 [Melanopsichium pennsylvanicum]|uniref:Golgi apparatus membrane protein TVP38 n=2 Tax=Melanopsichium pennsylvanicum TaxID=63383 RepID=A0AAJ5C2M9_9BASI|nr:conserved hypothetical protein [Melanopsichium pennsylvanicum 4]SNX81584.1 uncharacterized protein MEPE_00289 [Melanopsichium pennsylvanicum]
MSDSYHRPQQQPQRQPAYNNPLNIASNASNPHHRNPDSRQQQSHPFPPSLSSQNMLRPYDQDGVDYYHYHTPPSSQPLQPYHDPYATLTPAYEATRPSFSNEDLMRQTSAYSKDMHQFASDDGHDHTLRGTHYILAKDEDTGRLGYGRGHRIDATDGLLPDVPPDMDRLNPEQKEIMKQFPPDLDDEGGGKSGMQAAKDMLKDWRSWFKLKYLHWWVMGIVVIAIVVLTTIYHKQIVDWLTPISKKVTTVGWGWIIPVAILFIISFPPLFGHEIVLILVGLVYGIWIGFGIASLGTLLGEIGNFYAFKHCLRSTAANYERKNIHYACMAEMVRDGGFLVMFLARLSAIPGHFTTAVFATVGMNIFVFIFAAVLALPKQLLIVYLGVAIKNSGAGTEDTKSKIIKYVVLVISFIITIWTAYWLYQKMEKVRPTVAARLRQKRYELLLQARTPGTEGYSGERVPSYPPTAGHRGYGNGNGGFDATYAYKPSRQGSVRPFGVDEMYNGPNHPANVSTETYNTLDSMQPRSDRQPVTSVQTAQSQPQSGSTSPERASNQPPYPQESYTPNPHVQQPPPLTIPTSGGRQAITAPTQFHRPLHMTSSPTSPFQDPPSDGLTQPQMTSQNEERIPLTNAQGEWASTSSLASPVEQGPPPDYASYSPSMQGHIHVPQQHLQHHYQQQQHVHPGVLQIRGQPEARVDSTVQRYNLSD